MSSMKAWKLGILGLVALMLVLGGFADSASAQLVVTSPTAPLPAGGSGNTITFNLSGVDMSGGPITITPPAGNWSGMQVGFPGSSGFTTGVTLDTTGVLVPVGGLVIDPTDAAFTGTIIYGDIDPLTGSGGVTAAPLVSDTAHGFTFEQLDVVGGGSAVPPNADTIIIETEAVGSGSITGGTNVLGGRSGVNLSFTYTAVSDPGNTDILNAGTFEFVIPTGFTDPNTIVGTTDDTIEIDAFGGTVLGDHEINFGNSWTISIPIIAMSGGDSFRIRYSGVTIPVNGSSDPTAYTFTSRVGFGQNVDPLANGSPVVTATKAGAGSGTLNVIQGASVEAGATGNKTVFRYTAPGTLSGGALVIDVPDSFTVPQGAEGSEGHTSLSVGSGVATVAFGEDVDKGFLDDDINITINNLQINDTIDITFDNFTAPDDLGTNTFFAYVVPNRPIAKIGGNQMAQSPIVTVQSADGTGTVGVAPAMTNAGSVTTLTFTFVAVGNMDDGKVSLAVDPSWPLPAGNTVINTSGSTDTPVFIGRTVTVPINNLDNAQQIIISYTAVAPGTAQTSQFVFQSQGTEDGELTPVGDPLEVEVKKAADGSGTATVSPETLTAGSTGNVITITYTAVGTMDSGFVRVRRNGLRDFNSVGGAITVQSTGSIGAVTTDNDNVIVPIVDLEAGGTVTFTYTTFARGGAVEDLAFPVDSLGGAGFADFTAADNDDAAQIPPRVPGISQIAGLPTLDVKNAADGTGAGSIGFANPTTLGNTNVDANAATTDTFDVLFAPVGTLDTGVVEFNIPSGFPFPVVSTDGTVDSAGEFRVFEANDNNPSDGMVGGVELSFIDTNPPNFLDPAEPVKVFGRKITLNVGGAIDDDVDVFGPGDLVGIRYEAAVGITRGAFPFNIGVQGLDDSTLTNIATPPSITVGNVEDGTGTLEITSPADTDDPTDGIADIPVNTPDTTVEFVFKPLGPMDGGSLELKIASVPVAFPKPGGTIGANQPDEPGFVRVTPYDALGNVKSGSIGNLTFPTASNLLTVTIPIVQLTVDEMLVIEYGANGTTNGAITVPPLIALYNFDALSSGSSSGTLTNLAGNGTAPQQIRTKSLEGSGSIAVSPKHVVEGSTNSYTFTYTAEGAVRALGIQVPSGGPTGWSAPDADPAAPNEGFVAASAGTLSVTGQTINIQDLQLKSGEVVTVSYSNAIAPDVSGSTAGAFGVFSSANNTTVIQDPTHAVGGADDAAVFVVAGSGGKVVRNATDDHTTTSDVFLDDVRAAGSSTLEMHYKSEGFINGGELDINIGPPFTLPTIADAPGQVMAFIRDVGALAETDISEDVSIVGQSIVVPIDSLQGAAVGSPDGYVRVVYGVAGNEAVAPPSAGTYQFSASIRTFPNGTKLSILNNEVIAGTGGKVSVNTLSAASGSGTFIYTGPTVVNGGSNNNPFVFTYIAAGTFDGGRLRIRNPNITNSNDSSWSMFNVDDIRGNLGISSTGIVTVDEPTALNPSNDIVIGITELDPGDSVTINYGSGDDNEPTVQGVKQDGDTPPFFLLQSEGGEVTDAFANVTNPLGDGEAPVDVIQAADGSGGMPNPVIVSGAPIHAADAEVELQFIYTAVGQMNGGALRFVPGSGFTTPQGSPTVVGFTRIDSTSGATTLGSEEFPGDGSLIIPITQMGPGQTIVINYGNVNIGSLPGGPGSGAVASPVAGDSKFIIETKASASGIFTKIGSDPQVTVANAADGSGIGSASISEVTAGSPGNKVTFTFESVGTMGDGVVQLEVPGAWDAPTLGDDGNTSVSSTGSVDTDNIAIVLGNTIEVPILGDSLDAGDTITFVYTSRAPLAVVPTGNPNAQFRFTSDGDGNGIFVASTVVEIVTGPAANGSGSIASNKTVAKRGGTIPDGTDPVPYIFTFTAEGEMVTGARVLLVVADGWTPLDPDAGDPGEITVATSGLADISSSIDPAGNFVAVNIGANSLLGGDTLTFTYDKVTAPSNSGIHLFNVRTRGDGEVVAAESIPAPLLITTTSSGSGSGAAIVDNTGINAVDTEDFNLTYTAVEEFIGGEVTFRVPSGWSKPEDKIDPDDVMALDVGGADITAGSNLNVNFPDDRTISIGVGALQPQQQLLVPYIGATAQNAAGTAVMETESKVTATGALGPIDVSPSVAVGNVSDGRGAGRYLGGKISAASEGNSLSFEFEAAGTTDGGLLSFTVPELWTEPQGTQFVPGFTEVSTPSSGEIGSPSFSGRVVEIPIVQLGAGETVRIVYGSGSGSGGATAQPLADAAARFIFRLKGSSASDGELVALADPADADVLVGNVRDGSGTLTLDKTSLNAGDTAALTFSFSPIGTTDGGRFSITVPTDWPAPTASNTTVVEKVGVQLGALEFDGNTITAPINTLTAGQSVELEYRVVIPSILGDARFDGKSQGGTDGTLVELDTGSPSVTVQGAADGSGSANITSTTGPITAGSTGNTLRFTYTATGIMTEGAAVSFGIPDGFSPRDGVIIPTSTGNIDEDGTTVVNGVITVPINGLDPTQSITIDYDANAPTVAGNYGFDVLSQGSADGSLVPVSGSPFNIQVGNVADGSGTARISPSAVVGGSTGNTITVTYEAVGTIDDGRVIVEIPSDLTVGSANASSNDGANIEPPIQSGNQVAVRINTMEAGQTVDITLNDSTAPSALGPLTFPVLSRGSSGGTSTPVTAGSPSISVSEEASVLVFVNGSPNRQASLQVGVVTLTGLQNVGSPVTLETRDTNGNPAPSASALSVELSSSASTGAFGTTADGPFDVSSVTIPVNDTSIVVYYRDMESGTATLTATAPSFPEATRAATADITISKTGTGLSLSSADSVFVGDPLEVTVQVFDDDGNLSTPSADTTVNLSSTSGTFTPDSVTISFGETSATSIFTDTAPGSVDLTASGDGLTDGTGSVTVNPIILSVRVSGSPVRTGDTATITAEGKPGQGTATFTISDDIVTDKEMTEGEAGTYTGEFTPVVDIHSDSVYDVTVNLDGASLTVEDALEINNAAFTFNWSVPAGISFGHIPLNVIKVGDADTTLATIGDIFDVLVGSVNFLITYDGTRWISYLGDQSRGTPADRALTDDLGFIAVMSSGVDVDITGDALGVDGVSSIDLSAGQNLVGVPLQNSSFANISDLLGIPGVSSIIAANAGEFVLVGATGDAGDGPIRGDQSYILIAGEESSTEVQGDAWRTVSNGSAAPPAVMGYQSGTQTPVLNVQGIVVDEAQELPKDGIRLTVENLSTGASLNTDLGDEDGYGLTLVDLIDHAARVGDVLEVTAESPNPLLGIRPVRHIVTTDDVKTSRISLPDLVVYEIPALTELLPNFPNPFNPETWIPFRLAEDASVALTIYESTGRLVRTIEIGFTPAAIYESRSKAIYWDGRNNFGEQVASGIYFYHLDAESFSATRKMVILK